MTLPIRLLLSTLLALTAVAQDLAGIQREADAKLAAARRRILAEKYAALRTYVGRDVDPQPADLSEALLATAELAAEFDRAEAQQGFAARALKAAGSGRIAQRARLELGDAQARIGSGSAEIAETYEPLLAEASLQDESVDAALTAAVRLSGLLAERGELEPAKAIWSRLAEKLQHPQVAEIARMQQAQLERIGQAAPPIQAQDLSGAELTLAGLRGKVVLIDFWATWCTPCLQELPNVTDAYERFHAHGFEIIGVSLDQDRARLEQFLARAQLPWPQVLDAARSEPLANAYGVESIPATFLLGRDGKMARVGLRGDDLLDAVRMLVERKP